MTPHDYLEFTCPSAEAAWDLIDDGIKRALNFAAEVAQDEEEAGVALEEGRMEAAFMARHSGLI
tara:strand:+ start:125 stop:316 length:192 start_codon:yes stop_codon:yes gene_type:complete